MQSYRKMGKLTWLSSAFCCACVRQKNYTVTHDGSSIKDEPKNEVGAPEEEIDIDLNDPEVNAAATKIQASFKGHKARKEVQALKEHNEEEARLAAEAEAASQAPPIDIDLDDPEVAKSAVKIQSNFRGYKTRKEMKTKESKTEDDAKADEEKKAPEEEIDIDLNDPEVANAATKIQANFRGYKVRKGTKESKTEEAPPAEEGAAEEKKEEEEEIDIDLEDPETAKAAVKIQATFRGHKSRKEMKKDEEDA